MNAQAKQPLRILLSAYACEPGKGSEPGVGWNWALALARRGHHVWVLTRQNNRQAVEAGCAQLEPGIVEQLTFIYYDLPKWASWWKKGGRGVHLYYALWQRAIVAIAKRTHREINFDVVHHLTFGVWRQPSFLHKLGRPLIFGPVGGGESAPRYLERSLPLRSQLSELARTAVNWISTLNPSLRKCLKASKYVYAKTPETGLWINRSGAPCSVALEIGIDKQPETSRSRDSGPLKCLYAGRLVGWKGIHLAIAAIADAKHSKADVSLTVVGKGPMQASLKVLAKSLGVADYVSFVDWVSQSELRDLYLQHDLLLFPSLHDSSGNVVLEALANGMPVLCLDLGGPAVLVDATCGFVLSTTGTTTAGLVHSMGTQLVEVASCRDQLSRLSAGARAKALSRSWEDVAGEVYGPIESLTECALK